MRFIIVVIILIIFITGCVKQEQKEKEMAIELCIKACNEARAKGENLENGPCLLNPISDKYYQNLSKWVCDIAHSPRQPVDNQPENQCSAFREGIANHFVELTPSCEFIKAI